MTVLSDYVSGTISLTTGSVDFTGSATGWLLAAFKEGDTIIDITGATEFMGVIAEITSNTAGKLTKAWEGPDLVDAPYRMRYQADGSRVSAQARNLIELLGDGTLTSLAGLSGPGVIELLPGGGAQVVPKTDLVSGANYDVQVDDLAARAVYDGQAEGFSVLVADVGDGRSAIYSKASNAGADWTDPAYVTGPIGETPDVTVGTVTTGAPGTDVEVTATPITGGVELDFTIPAGEGFSAKGAYSGATAYAKGDVVRDAGSSWIALQATTGNAPPTLPTTSNAYWELLVAKGQDGTGTGDVVGPSGATSNRLAVYDGGTGKLLKDGGKLVGDVVTGPASATAGRVAILDATGKVIADGGKTIGELDEVKSGALVQSVRGTYSTNENLTANIPADDTIPQNTEGTSIISVTITPKFADSIIRFRFAGTGSASTTAALIAAIFLNSGANAIASTYVSIETAGYARPLTVEGQITPGSTSALTLTIRVGSSGGTARMNGNASGRFLGGTMVCNLLVDEVRP